MLSRIIQNPFSVYALAIVWAAMEINAILTIILFRINDLWGIQIDNFAV